MAEGKYTAAQKMIDARRQKAIAVAAAHAEEIERILPQVRNLRAARRRRFASASMSLLRSDMTVEQKKEQLNRLQEESVDIDQSIKELLVRCGYPADYLEEKFVCPL